MALGLALREDTASSQISDYALITLWEEISRMHGATRERNHPHCSFWENSLLTSTWLIDGEQHLIVAWAAQ
ncbi:hypothetical protein PROFUN_00115 [Planoprotostelium fungivorum]|uniref:Uncharacterized protein n=1 Tax=Planoprotostelium fungivorum TaxID=1890364 RepID=A0A2P6P0P4_9EUKA|nr:hypothetical protein PROFUN_00115 [Planoprotostelium fungivorum]